MDYAGSIIERKDGKMLFQLRDDNKKIYNPNQWGLFGGGIKFKETPKKAIIREIKEELDLDINEKDLKFLIKIPFLKGRRYIFKINLNKKTSELKLNEGSDLDYFSIKEILIKKNVVPSLRNFLFFYPLINFFRR